MPDAPTCCMLLLLTLSALAGGPLVIKVSAQMIAAIVSKRATVVGLPYHLSFLRVIASMIHAPLFRLCLFNSSYKRGGPTPMRGSMAEEAAKVQVHRDGKSQGIAGHRAMRL